MMPDTLPQSFGGLPPGPAQVITADEIRDDPLAFLTTFADTYGPISFHRTEAGESVFMVTTAELAGEVLSSGENRFTKNETADDYMLTPLLGEGLLTSHGEEWRRQRDITQPMFQRHRIEAFGPKIVESAKVLATRWAHHSTNQPITVDLDLTALALEVVAFAILGGDLSGVGQGFGLAVDAVNAAMSHGDPNDTPDDPEVLAHYAEFGKAKRTIDRVVTLLIDARKLLGGADDGPADLLTVLLESVDPITGEPLTAEELKAQVMTMVMAGHETTAKSLTWSLYLLSQHPDVAHEVHIELQSVLGGRDVTIDDIPQLPIIRSVLQEAMRLYPPIWIISRRAVNADTLGGYDIPAGSLICVSPWVIHHSNQYWDNPEHFEPSRFRSNSGPVPYTYVPFGGGPRVCIGRGFALIEAQLILATLCQRLDFTLWPNHVVVPEALVTLRPGNGMAMSVSQRSFDE
jgi:cytochrome P450